MKRYKDKTEIHNKYRVFFTTQNPFKLGLTTRNRS